MFRVVIAFKKNMSKLKKVRNHLLVCTHKTCIKQGGEKTIKQLKKTLKKRGLQSEVLITEVDCLDQCGRGPVVIVYPEGVWYGSVDENCAKEIIKQNVAKGRATKCAKILHEM